MFLVVKLVSITKLFAVMAAGYLDPGSGSFILQVLLASLVGIGFAFRNYWNKLLGIFRKEKIEDDFLDQEDE